LAEALVLFDEALRCAPDLARAHAGRAATLVLLGRLSEGIAGYQRAVRLQPDYTRAWSNLAGSYLKAGDADRAVESYQRASQNSDFDLHSSFLYSLNFHSGWTAEQVFTAHAEWGRGFPNKNRRHGNVRPALCSTDYSTGRPLRIGYVSADFREHAVCRSIECVLAAHDPNAVEVTCYDNSATGDQTTERLQKLVHRWRKIAGLSDAEADATIRRDRIEILIDLAGHTAGNRMSLFARKPAPVQATYQGYPNTTGLPAIDYRITDALADPPGLTESFHSEELLRLPRCFLCYRHPAPRPEIRASPAATKGYFTFGSFSAPPKWNPTVLKTWASILRQVPESRLLLHHGGAANKTSAVHDAVRSRVLGAFEAQGVAPERIRLVGFLPLQEHLAQYDEIDLALDPFPYNGTTATCEALWMGLPVVALEGATHASRVGKSLLTTVGLERFLAQSIDDYIKLAVRIASRPGSLSPRREVHAKMAQSPLLDGQELARVLEQAYRWMWRRYTTGKA
jgi:protein O-GlcNAc transferase